MNTQLITRVGFCERCLQHHNPRTGQLVLFCGSHGFYVKEALVPKYPLSHPVGFTPHLYSKLDVIGGTVNVKKVCCVNGCDILIKPNANDTFDFYILETKWQYTKMPVADWNALLNFKRDKNYII